MRAVARRLLPAAAVAAGLSLGLAGCSDAPATEDTPQPPRIGSFTAPTPLPLPAPIDADLAPRLAALEATVARLEARLAQSTLSAAPLRGGAPAAHGSPQVPEPPSPADAEARTASLDAAFRAEAASPGPSLAAQALVQRALAAAAPPGTSAAVECRVRSCRITLHDTTEQVQQWLPQASLQWAERYSLTRSVRTGNSTVLYLEP